MVCCVLLCLGTAQFIHIAHGCFLLCLGTAQFIHIAHGCFKLKPLGDHWPVHRTWQKGVPWKWCKSNKDFNATIRVIGSFVDNWQLRSIHYILNDITQAKVWLFESVAWYLHNYITCRGLCPYIHLELQQNYLVFFYGYGQMRYGSSQMPLTCGKPVV